MEKIFRNIIFMLLIVSYQLVNAQDLDSVCATISPFYLPFEAVKLDENCSPLNGINLETSGEILEAKMLIVPEDRRINAQLSIKDREPIKELDISINKPTIPNSN